MNFLHSGCGWIGSVEFRNALPSASGPGKTPGRNSMGRLEILNVPAGGHRRRRGRRRRGRSRFRVACFILPSCADATFTEVGYRCNCHPFWGAFRNILRIFRLLFIFVMLSLKMLFSLLHYEGHFKVISRSFRGHWTDALDVPSGFLGHQFYPQFWMLSHQIWRSNWLDKIGMVSWTDWLIFHQFSPIFTKILTQSLTNFHQHFPQLIANFF